jgi:trehalose 6-phosphate phosphatase
MNPSLHDVATAETLLIVSDFDGTLAGIVPDPSAVPVHRGGLGALARLAGLPGTTAAILSGRGREDLRRVCPLRAPVVLAGSHGAESGEHGVTLTEEMVAALESVATELDALTRPDGSVYVERKPFQTVFHVAPLAARDPVAAAALLEQARLVYAHGTTVAGGKNIVEFSAATVTKGTWIAAERAHVGAERTVFVGDDVTDENGFAALGPEDLGVKVGDGETLATVRVADRDAAAEWLTQLAAARAAHTGIPADRAARFRAVAAGFTAVAVQVTDWDAHTPCERWRAREVVAHLAHWYPQNLKLAGVDLHLTVDAHADPLGAWYELAQAVQGVLEDPARAQAVYADGHDEGATVERATNGYFIPDVFMHTWDLARSQGLSVELDPDFARRQLQGLRGLGQALQDGGQFAAPREVAEGASAGDELMAFSGRDPEFGLR